MEEKIAYFKKGGKGCTDDALMIAKEYCETHNTDSIVVASTTGYTAEKAADIFENKNLVIVTHVYGFRKSNSVEFPEDLRKALRDRGVKMITAAHAMGGVNNLADSSIGSIIANTLRTFSQGTKVCLEIAAEAADSGHVNTKDEIIAIGGTGRGADTVMVIKPEISRRFFDMEVKKILALPLDQ